MAYHEEETTKLRRQASRQAISLAMEGRWREAVTANQTLIESFPDDVDAYNRLGRAYLELGELSQAKEAYQNAARIDPYNTIAQKNISRLARLEETGADLAVGQGKVEPQQFIEEIAKAGVVGLRRLAGPEILAKAVAGSPASLRIEESRLIVENGLGEYLGQVEPRHGQRLIRLMEGGNRYSAHVVSSAEDSVTVIIREVYQHPDLAGQPSFPSRGPETSKGDIDDRIGDRMIRRTLENLEFEEALPGDTGYAIVDGDDVEIGALPGDAGELDEGIDNEESED